MADGEEVEHAAEVNGEEKQDERPVDDAETQYRSLAGDKEDLGPRQDWQKIKVEAALDEEHADANGISQLPTDANEEPAGGEQHRELTRTPTSPPPPPLPEKDQLDGPSPAPTPISIGALPSTGGTNGTALEDRQRSDSASTQATNGARRSSAPLSSIVFVVTAFEQIAASKEARKRKPLGDAVQKALAAIKQQDASPSPEIIFEPLRLATETSSIPLTTTALDCIGKLISYSYFSVQTPHSDPNLAPEKQQQLPLIDRAIETICDCFQDEATQVEVQLQIVKSLLAAVLNDKLIVHGSGLLKAVRQVYNIFLLSKSGANQQVAQGTLTQMVGTVFERVTTRLSMKEARLNLARIGSGKGTANASQIDVDGSISVIESGEGENALEPDGSSEGNSIITSDQPVPKEPGERLTLQSLEHAKSFDDRRIGDNAPTMVTPAKSTLKSLRTASGQPVSLSSGEEAENGHEDPDEDEEDEIYVKDAFLVFRSMCRLSTKELLPDQQQDIKSSNMRSKLVSLAIIRTVLNNNITVFTSPLCTIRSSSNNEPTSFGQAINQYLRLSVSRNGASSVKQVFEICAEIFWLMVKDLRVMLKVRCLRKFIVTRHLICYRERSNSS